MATLRVTAKDIRAMNETQWNEYRLSRWIEKQNYYKQEMPAYHLPNKNKYAQYLEDIEKNPKAKVRLNISSDDIRNMNENQWNEYRRNHWKKQGAKYEGEMPAYFLRDQEKYAQFLEKIEARLASKK